MKKYVEKRPWGNFEKFCENETATVKIITVNPNSKLSLQYHNQRSEFWKVIEGSGKVVLGEKIFDVCVGDEIEIPVKTNHRIITNESSMKIMEISFGKFDEDDIVRVEDDYNRI